MSEPSLCKLISVFGDSGHERIARRVSPAIQGDMGRVTETQCLNLPNRQACKRVRVPFDPAFIVGRVAPAIRSNFAPVAQKAERARCKVKVEGSIPSGGLGEIMPAGRPKTITNEPQEVVELICSGLSVKKSCDQVGISHVHFYRMVNADKELCNQYARAMEQRADVIFDQILGIADNDDPDADVQRDRLRVDARKWVVSKMLPKKYGDKQETEISGGLNLHADDGLTVILNGITPVEPKP